MKVRTIIILGLGLLATACNRGNDEFVIPYGHPADPGAPAGAVLSSSNSLEPELQTVKPEVLPAAGETTAPSSGGHQHQH